MATDVYFAASADGFIDSSSGSNYAAALAGVGTIVAKPSDTFGWIGQDHSTATWYVDQAFLGFDASAIDDADVVSAAVIAVFGKTDGTTQDFSIQCATFDWSSGNLTTADWRTAAQLSALTPLGSVSTSGYSTSAYNTLADLGGMAASVSKTGTSYYVLFSDRNRSSTIGSSEEDVTFWQTEQTGTTNDPKLTVTHAAAQANVPRRSPYPQLLPQ